VNANTWNHPRLGEFEQDDLWWRREITLPSLDSFTYYHYVIPGRGPERLPFELVLQCDAEGEQPTEEMASLAAAVLDNEPRLMPTVLEAIWSDLNGRGLDSGMWWHGDLPYAYLGGNFASAVQENLTDFALPIPASASDLLKILEPKDLLIRRDFSPPDQWLASLNFHAGFEVEHGLGVLTNGVEILGIGYSVDATRFKQ
jgi:hypothetical protein